MIYYKEIDIQFYDIIIQKSLDFVKQEEAIFNRRDTRASLYWFNFRNYETAVPEIKIAFDEHKLKCIGAAVYVMYDPKHTSLHADSTLHQSRINLPLLNCGNTFTHFYSGCHLERWSNPATGNVSYIVTNPNDAKLESTVEMKKTTVVRISEPHYIELPENNPVPRIVLSLKFNKDPTFLLNG